MGAMTRSAALPGAAGAPSSSSSSATHLSTTLARDASQDAAHPSSTPYITVEELLVLLEGQARPSLEELASTDREPRERYAAPTSTAGKANGDDDSSYDGAQALRSSPRLLSGRPEAQQLVGNATTSAEDRRRRRRGGRGGDDGHHDEDDKDKDDVEAGSKVKVKVNGNSSKARLGDEAELSSLPATTTPTGCPSREAVLAGIDNGKDQRPSAASSSSSSSRTSLLSPHSPLPLHHHHQSSNSPLTAAAATANGPSSTNPTRRKLIIFDSRPLDAYLHARIAGSINIALPTLVVRRMRRSALASLSKATSSSSSSTAASTHHHLTHLSDYITTASGKRKFEQALDSLSTDDERTAHRSPRSPLDLWRADIVVVVPPPPPPAALSSSSAATSSSYEASKALCEALDNLEHPPRQAGRGRTTLFNGDFAGMLSSPQAAAFVERGAETRASTSMAEAAALKEPGTSSPAPAGQEANAAPAPAPPPKKPPTPPKARPGRPSLARLDTGEKVQTLGSLGASNVAKPGGSGGGGGGGPYNSAPLRLGPTNASLQPPPSRTAFATPVTGAAAEMATMSLQGLAHMQAKLPPSPASFGDMSLPLSPAASSSTGFTSSQAGRELARRGSEQAIHSPLSTSHGDGAAAAVTDPIAANAVGGFDVSTVVPSFLYLGPDITTAEEAAQLRSLGIRRILNCAAEVSDKSQRDDHDAGGGATVRSPLSCLGTPFDRYLKIPMWDNVEAQHVQEDIEQACAFLDEAREANAPVYVHCRAGKSRSVSVVMGWLIHAYKWPLKKAYEYVSERRADVSPNIGFISCLMAFEELKLRGGGGGGAAVQGGGAGAGEAAGGDMASQPATSQAL